MNKFYLCFLLLTNILLTACQADNTTTNQPINNAQQSTQKIPINTEEFTINNNFKPIVGQTIYVPVYSHVYFLNKRRVYNLAANVSVHNTDLETALIIKSIKYYDTTGKLLDDYLPNPVKLNPLASTDFFIEQNDPRGGLGANFIIEWVADKKVSSPIVESVMLGTSGTQGVSFLSTGRVIKEYQN